MKSKKGMMAALIQAAKRAQYYAVIDVEGQRYTVMGIPAAHIKRAMTIEGYRDKRIQEWLGQWVSAGVLINARKNGMMVFTELDEATYRWASVNLWKVDTLDGYKEILGDDGICIGAEILPEIAQALGGETTFQGMI